jgi:hypothetical protein
VKTESNRKTIAGKNMNKRRGRTSGVIKGIIKGNGMEKRKQVEKR